MIVAKLEYFIYKNQLEYCVTSIKMFMVKMIVNKTVKVFLQLFICVSESINCSGAKK